MGENTRTFSPFVVWLGLIFLTLASFGIFAGRILASLSTLAIVAIAAFKSRLVILHFMEATHAPGNWRFLYETWVFVVAAIIIIGHYVTIARIE